MDEQVNTMRNTTPIWVAGLFLLLGIGLAILWVTHGQGQYFLACLGTLIFGAFWHQVAVLTEK